MTTIRLKRIEYHSVIQVHYDEIDVSDQEKWDYFRENCPEWFEEELSKLPKKAPKDIKKWLELYSLMAEGLQSNSEPDNWVSISKGNFPVEFEAEDASGKRLHSIRNELE